MEEFIPCPFCNKPMSEDNFFSCDGYPQACGCWEKTHSCEEALKVWNSRPREEALQKRIDELEADNEHTSGLYENLLQTKFDFDGICEENDELQQRIDDKEKERAYIYEKYADLVIEKNSLEVCIAGLERENAKLKADLESAKVGR